MFSKQKNNKKIIIEFNLNEIEFHDCEIKARIMKMTIPQYIQWFFKFRLNTDIVEFEGERMSDLISGFNKEKSFENVYSMSQNMIRFAVSSLTAYECAEEFKIATGKNQ